MKKLSLYVLLFFLSIIVVVACSKSKVDKETEDEGTTETAHLEKDSEKMTDAGYKRYRIESGIVEYSLSGMQEGTKTIYFDEWGWREAEYLKAGMTVGGMTIEENKLSLLDGEWQYVIDLNKRTGTKIQNPFLKQMADGADTKDLTEMGEKMLESMGGKMIGSEVIAGKKCDIWEIKNLNTKSWIWNGVTLKTQMKMSGMEQTIVATRVEEGVSIDDKYLTIPSDVKLEEGKSMQDINKMLEDMKKRQ